MGADGWESESAEEASPFEVLGLAAGASEFEIKAAWKQKSLQYHPDKNPDDARDTQSFQRLSEAYEALSDPQRRMAWACIAALRTHVAAYGRRPCPAAFAAAHAAMSDAADRLRNGSSEQGRIAEVLHAEVRRQVQKLAACMRSRCSGSPKVWIEKMAAEILEVRNCLYCLQYGCAPLHRKSAAVLQLRFASMQEATKSVRSDAKVRELSEAFWSRVVEAVEADDGPPSAGEGMTEALVALVDVWSRCGSIVTPLLVALPELKEKPVAALRAWCIKLLSPRQGPTPSGLASAEGRLFSADRRLLVVSVVEYLSKEDLVQVFGLDQCNSRAGRLLQLAPP